MKYNYFAFDLDGTLLNSEKIITPDTLNVVNTFHKKGVGIILISSRHFYEITDYSKQLCLNEHDFIISCDGQYIYDGNEKILFESDYLNTVDVKRIYDLTKSPLSFYSNEYDYYYSNKRKKGTIKKIKSYINERKKLKTQQDGRKWGEVYYLSLYRKIKIEKIVITGLIDNLEILSSYNIISDNGRVDILKKDVSKYNALKKLHERGIVNLEKLLYFGDSQNDLECFKYLAHTVAMANADANIFNYAEFTTDSCDEDGISHFLSKL